MSSSNYLFKSNNYIITTIIIVLLSLLWLLLLQLLFWLILPVQLFLRNQVGESSKQGIQAAWSTPIHHVKWWISRFRGIYKEPCLAASEAGLFLIILRGLRPLCKVTRSSVLVAVGVLYLPLYFIIIITIIIIVVVLLLLLLLYY